MLGRTSHVVVAGQWLVPWVDELSLRGGGSSIGRAGRRLGYMLRGGRGSARFIGGRVLSLFR
jgi:hypothetical protein